MNLRLICQIFISVGVLQTHLAAVLLNVTRKPSYWYTLPEKPNVPFRCAYCRDEDAEKQIPVPIECFNQLKDDLIKEEVHDGVIYSPLCLGTRGTKGGYYKNCTAPPAGDHFKAHCPDGFLFDHQCTLTSTKERFVPTPNFTLCQADGNWTEFELTATHCMPVEDRLDADEKTACMRNEYLPVGTECEVRNNKNEGLRRLQCNKSGKWKLKEHLKPVSDSENTEYVPKWVLSAVIVVVVVVVAAVTCLIIVVCICVKRRQQKLASSPASSQAGAPLIRSISPLKQEEFPPEDISSNNDDSEGSLREDYVGEPPLYSFRDPLKVDETCQAAAAVENCNGMKLCYKIGDSEVIGELTEFGVTPIGIKAGSVLTVYGESASQKVTQFIILGFGRKSSKQENGVVKISIDESYHDKEYLAFAEFEEGMIIGHFRIVVTDHNPGPDSTFVKQRFKISTLSLPSTESTHRGSTLNAGSGPSEKLKAEPFTSLESHPQPLYESSNSLSKYSEGPADNPEDCTLLLSRLKRKNFEKTLNQLRLKLEPIHTVEMSVAGVAEAQNVVSADEVNYIIWAKREDLKHTPATVMLNLMMQHGKRAVHIVTYFANSTHRRLEIVELLQEAHPGCPACSKYG